MLLLLPFYENNQGLSRIFWKYKIIITLDCFIRLFQFDTYKSLLTSILVSDSCKEAPVDFLNPTEFALKLLKQNPGYSSDGTTQSVD